MSEIQIDHEAVKKCAQECVELASGRVDDMRKSNMAGTVGLSVAYLDLSEQLATANARIEKYQKRLEITHCYDGHTGERKDIAPEKRDTYPDGIECRDSTIHILNEQLAAEREQLDLYKKTIKYHAEVLSKFFQGGQKYNHFGCRGADMIDAVPKLVEAYEAERARVEALVGLVEECIDSIDNWGCAGSDEYRERHGLIEEIEGYKAQLATIMKGRDHA